MFGPVVQRALRQVEAEEREERAAEAEREQAMELIGESRRSQAMHAARALHPDWVPSIADRLTGNVGVPHEAILGSVLGAMARQDQEAARERAEELQRRRANRQGGLFAAEGHSVQQVLAAAAVLGGRSCDGYDCPHHCPAEGSA